MKIIDECISIITASIYYNTHLGKLNLTELGVSCIRNLTIM